MPAIIVLGMHKSGTTLIADTLHQSGISMIGTEAVGGYDDGNKMERAETRALNMDLLGDDGTKSLRLIRPLVPEAVTPSHLDQGKALIRAMGTTTWGFKDPRTLLTFDFWEELVEAPMLIGIYRDPVEVFAHYVKRAGRRWVSRDPSFLPDALLAWCVYNQRLLDLKRRYPNLLIVDYAGFMTSDTAMQRLSDHVDHVLVDCRRAAMRRAQPMATADYRLARLIVRLRNRMDPDRIHAQLIEAASE